MDIEHIRTSSGTGIGIKLVRNGIWSFCSITNPESFEQIKKAIDNTIQNLPQDEKIELVCIQIQLTKQQ